MSHHIDTVFVWSGEFAAQTVPAYPDLELHKDRHVGVVAPNYWCDWLQQIRPPLDILRSFPRGNR